MMPGVVERWSLSQAQSRSCHERPRSSPPYSSLSSSLSHLSSTEARSLEASTLITKSTSVPSATTSLSEKSGGASTTEAVSDPTKTSSPDGSHSSSSKTPIIVGILVAVLILCSVIAIFYVYRRQNRRKNPKTPNSESRSTHAGPGFFDRALGFLRPGRGLYQSAGDDDAAENTTTRGTNDGTGRPRVTFRAANSGTNNTAGASNTATNVDRNTSVRSVMSLPAYRQSASHTEQVLGREGERDGIDVIIDLPTAEDEEAAREDEMNTLFQIRELRRQQHAEREQRRVARQEARARNDSAALAVLRAQTRTGTTDQQVIELRAEVDRIKDNRQRSVSSVSYADLGVARHDGTRIRANSNESERMGLLSDAASISQSMGRHQRGQSSASIVSLGSDLPSPGLTRFDSSVHQDRAGSSPELVDAPQDGHGTAPPPEYEDVSLEDDDDTSLRRSTTPNEPPPDYPGPVRTISHESHESQASRESYQEPPHESQEDLPSANTHEQPDMTERPIPGLLNSGGASSGVGVPRLPSLRLANLPSIVVDEPRSAEAIREEEEEEARS